MPQHHHTTPAPALLPVPVAVLLPTTHPNRRHIRPHARPVDPSGLTAETACRLIATYTRPGDLIADLHTSPAVAQAATWLDRHTTRTITHRHRTDEPGQARTRPTLLLAPLPHPEHTTLDLPALAQWMRHVRTSLRPGGYLVASVSAEGPDGRYADHATTVITAARTAGLIYHQHLISVHVPLPEHEPKATEDRLHQIELDLLHGRHLRVHSDLYVFTTTSEGTDA